MLLIVANSRRREPTGSVILVSQKAPVEERSMLAESGDLPHCGAVSYTSRQPAFLNPPRSIFYKTSPHRRRWCLTIEIFQVFQTFHSTNPHSHVSHVEPGQREERTMGGA